MKRKILEGIMHILSFAIIAWALISYLAYSENNFIFANVDSIFLNTLIGLIAAWAPLMIWSYSQSKFYLKSACRTSIHFDEIFEIDIYKGGYVIHTNDDRFFRCNSNDHMKWLMRKENGWKGW